MSCRQGIVVWGGQRVPTYFNDGALFDPVAETWNVVPPAPFLPHLAPGIAVPQGVLFFGGEEVAFDYDDQGRRLVLEVPTPRALLLDLESFEWRELPPCPFGPRSQHTLFGVDDIVYFWAGKSARGWAEPVFGSFDLASETWSDLQAPGDLGRIENVGLHVDGAYLIWGGGSASHSACAEGAMFDFTSREWRSIAPAPLGPRVLVGACWSGELVLIAGGLADDQRGLRDGAACDPQRDLWTPMSSAPTALGGEGVWAGDRALFPSSSLAYDPASDSWDRYQSGGPSPVVTWSDSVYGFTQGAEIWGDAQLVVWEPDGAPPAPPPAQPTVTVAPGTLERLSATTGGMRFELRDAVDAESAQAAMRDARRRVLAIRHPEEPDEPFASYASAVDEREGVITFVVDMADAEAYEGTVDAALDAVVSALAEAGIHTGTLSAG